MRRITGFWREKTKHSVEGIKVEVPIKYENGNWMVGYVALE